MRAEHTVATTNSVPQPVKRRELLPTAATLGALGVVYGDIGTSPLYALKEAVKATSGGGTPVSSAVLGVVSLVIWSLIVIVSLSMRC